MLNAYNKYIISIYKVLRNRSNYINNAFNIIMFHTLITSVRVYSNKIQINKSKYSYIAVNRIVLNSKVEIFLYSSKYYRI